MDHFFAEMRHPIVIRIRRKGEPERELALSRLSSIVLTLLLALAAIALIVGAILFSYVFIGILLVVLLVVVVAMILRGAYLHLRR